MNKPTRICSVEGCDKEVEARGWCAMHYARYRRHGDPTVVKRGPGRVCSIGGCGKKHSARGYCHMHYKRMLRNGDPLKRVRMVAPDRCAIEGCEGKPVGRGWCKLHWQRWYRTGDPLGVRDLKGDNNGMWVGDDANYFGIHTRLGAVRGKASERLCEHCGEPAEHWAYTHDDPEEKVSADGLAYSVRIEEFYVPLCVECHSRFDVGREVTGAR